MINKEKTVFVLIGPKGTGKTFTGQLLEQELGIKFLNVERIGLENIAKSKLTGLQLIIETFDLEEIAMDQILMKNPNVSFESTGAHEYFYIFLDRLRTKYNVKLIRIFTPLEICSERIKQRDSSVHIPVSDEMIQIINEKAARVELSWDLVLDNSNQASKEQIVTLFKKLLN